MQDMNQNSMDRLQSRNSQVLTISRWLRNAGKNECYAFLETLRNELGHQSIGSLLSLFIVNNSSALTNQNLDKLCLLCQDYTTENKIEKARNETQNPATKTKQTAIQQQSPLCSLSNDSFCHLSRYLFRNDGIQLGLCCHRLYQATQTISFLSHISFGEAWLTSFYIHKIYEYKADPWMYFVNCKHLTVASSLPGGIGIENTRTSVAKLRKCRNYTNWMDKMMFCQLESLIIGYDGDKLLSCLSVNWIDMIFGLQRLNKHTNRLEMKNQNPLRLVFKNLCNDNHTIPISKTEEFFNTYYSYLVTHCDNKLANIRNIGVLECDNARSYGTISKNIGKYLQPNYKCFRCRDGMIMIHSIEQFCRLFHENLVELDMEMLRFENYGVMREIYQTIVENGYIFQLSDCINRGDYQDFGVLTDEQVEYICGDEQLINEMTRLDAILAVGGVEIRPLFQKMWHSKSAYDFFINSYYNNSNDSRYKYDCLYRAYYVSIVAWINDRLDWICNGIKYKLSKNSKSKLHNVLASKRLLKLTSAVNKKLQVKTFRNTQKTPTWSPSVMRFLKNFNRMIRNGVLFRLLKFGQTVENLSLEFIPQVSLVDVEYQDDSNVWHFIHVIRNIFEHFKNVRNVSICMNFGTNFRECKLRTEQEIVDAEYIFTLQEMIEAVTDYITIYASTVVAAVEKHYHKLKQRGFSMQLNAWIGDNTVEDVNNCIKVEDYLVNKGLMNINQAAAIQTTFDIYHVRDIQTYGQNVIKAADPMLELIKNAGFTLRNNRYYASTYRFWIPPNNKM